MTIHFVLTVLFLTALGVGIWYAGVTWWHRSPLRARWSAVEAGRRVKGGR